jgi:GNAT superfamily N-acetyltransferase
VETDFGLMFFNEWDPDSYDSNHALILNFRYDTRKAVDEIIEFYREKNLVPRIYSAFLPEDEKKRLLPVLEKKCFVIEENSSRLYLQTGRPDLSADYRLQMKKTRRLKPKARAVIFREDNGDWNVKKLERHLKDPAFHFFEGWIPGKKLACMVSLNVRDDIARIDDVLTASEFRHQGYASELINYIVHYFRNSSKAPLYLFAYNPITEKVYRKAGFKPMEKPLFLWTAYQCDARAVV